MTIRFRTSRLARTFCTAVPTLTAGLTALAFMMAPASAARTRPASTATVGADPTWNVTNTSADGSFTAGLITGTVTLTDTVTGAATSCGGSSITGSAPTATNLANPVATFNTTLTDCSGPLGSQAGSIGPASLSAEVYPAPGTTNTIGGFIGNISITLTITTPIGICTVTATGSIGEADDTVTYDNDSGVLTIPPFDLTVSSTSGVCAGFVNVGDPIMFGGASYQVPGPIPAVTIVPFTG